MVSPKLVLKITNSTYVWNGILYRFETQGLCINSCVVGALHAAFGRDVGFLDFYAEENYGYMLLFDREKFHLGATFEIPTGY